MALTQVQRVGYGLTDMGILPFVVAKQLLVFEFLTRGLSIPVDVAGLVTSGVLVFDMITDPLIGWLSDRTKSRWGRRLPWMVAGAPLMVLGMWALFQAPAGGLAWVVAFFALASVGFTMIAIPYSAIAAEMTDDPKERSVLTAWRMGFASLGLLIGGGMIPAMQQQYGYAGAVLAMAPLIVGAIWLSALLVCRAPRREQVSSLPWRDQMRVVFRNRGFVTLMVGYGVMTLAIGILTAGLAYAASDLVAVADGAPLAGLAQAMGVMPILFGAFVVGALISQPIWALASHRFGKLPALIVGLGLYALLLVAIAGLLRGMPVHHAALMFVAAGMCNGSYQQIPWAMFPDLVDHSHDATGEAVEGAFSAVWLLGQKLGNALGPALLGAILAGAGWIEGQGVTQSDAALDALAWAMSLLPAMILVVSAVGLAIVFPRAVRRLG